MIHLFFLSPETHRLLKLMYDDEEYWEVLDSLKDSDGWLIISFNERPVLDPVNAYNVVAYNWRLN